jgi:hypothetical protein
MMMVLVVMAVEERIFFGGLHHKNDAHSPSLHMMCMLHPMYEFETFQIHASVYSLVLCGLFCTSLIQPFIIPLVEKEINLCISGQSLRGQTV